MTDIPLIFKDEHVNKLFIVAVPLTINDDMHRLALLNVVNHIIYNDVFIEIPSGFTRIVSQYPQLVFNNMLLIEGKAIVKSPTRL